MQSPSSILASAVLANLERRTARSISPVQMKTKTKPVLTPFANQWQINAIAYSLQAQREGITAMSADNLFNVVRIPSDSLPGAPRGTNARYYARETFTQDVIATSPALRRFTAI